MDHHTSWLSFLPGYSNLHEYLQHHYGNTTVIPAGGSITTVHHIYAALIVLVVLAVTSLMARSRFVDLDKAVAPPRTFGVVAFYELFIETIIGQMAAIIGPSYKR